MEPSFLGLEWPWYSVLIPVKSVENWMHKEEFRPILGHLFQSEEYACKEAQVI